MYIYLIYLSIYIHSNSLRISGLVWAVPPPETSACPTPPGTGWRYSGWGRPLTKQWALNHRILIIVNSIIVVFISDYDSSSCCCYHSFDFLLRGFWKLWVRVETLQKATIKGDIVAGITTSRYVSSNTPVCDVDVLGLAAMLNC